ncbi:HAMP domain-containing histidine kinase [Leptolyngbya sp. NK1-12]|uniref:histidine kinase n=1 Tax=Leptolyngbya sp. NK1-12 TaxID=2547451 RepID=A0AA96WXP7_9CYAN|nr:HAMP domain-containing histidine kinase [Leptolyngbya sp. NK1-12]
MYKWYLPTLSEILSLSGLEQNQHPIQDNQSHQFPAQQRLKAEREWAGAVAALNGLLQQGVESESTTLNSAPQGSQNTPPVTGLLLSGPFPVLQQAAWMDQIATWVFTVGSPGEVVQLLPAAEHKPEVPWKEIPTLPLRPDDPLAAEQFCLALTPEFSLVMTLGETAAHQPAFLFSFDPDVVWQVWRSLQARLQLTAPPLAAAVDRMVKQFTPVVPDYRIVTQFSRLMLANLPEPFELVGKRAVSQATVVEPVMPTAPATPPSTPAVSTQMENAAESVQSTPSNCVDAELLQALAHEVRTPLTTIRTLTRLLLKRKDLNPDVLKRLEVIDRECTEQIDRFNLIFRAVELETTQTKQALMPLAPISLTQVIQQNLARWQQQASQYSHKLDILLPQKLPMVVTDPVMLDQALTGLIDRITHRLPPGSHIQVQVALAGHQLKLQFLSQPQSASTTLPKDSKAKMGFAPAVRSIGQLLMFQPETGSLSLSLAVTKNLFQALGGKMTVREHPQAGEVLTIFLPLASRKPEE